MSTDFRLLQRVRACDLFDGRIEEFGVREHVKPDATTKKRRCLTDGCNYLWVYIDDDGFVSSLSRFAPNGDPSEILDAIAVALDTYIASAACQVARPPVRIRPIFRSAPGAFTSRLSTGRSPFPLLDMTTTATGYRLDRQSTGVLGVIGPLPATMLSPGSSLVAVLCGLRRYLLFPDRPRCYSASCGHR
jgi:hypothetical protein